MTPGAASKSTDQTRHPATTARSRPRERQTPGKDRIPILLFALAAAERLSFLIGSLDRGWPFSIFYEGDARRFFDYAQAILAGQRYDNGIPFHPPLFPLVLAALHGIMGPPAPNELLRAMLGVASAVVPVLLYRILRDWVGRGTAAVAGVLAAFSFGLDMIGTAATSEGTYLILLMVAVYLAARAPEEGRRGLVRGAAIGALGGLAALTRAEGLLATILIAAVWLGREAIARTHRRVALRAALAWSIGLLCVILPWTIRNAVVLSEWNAGPGRTMGTRLPTLVPITSYGPLNFALANCDSATGGFQRKLLPSKATSGVLDLSDPQHRHYFLHGGSEGLGWIAGHPGAFARLAGRKLDITSRALDLGWTAWNLPLGRTGVRRPVDVFAPGATGLRWAQLVLSLAGAWILLRRRGRGQALLLAAPIVSAVLAAVLFFGYVRLGVLALPFLFAFEGVALSRLSDRFPDRARRVLRARWTRWTLAAVAAAILILATVQNRNYRASGTTDRPGGKLDPDAEMRITPIR